jgi:hypothetical protein
MPSDPFRRRSRDRSNSSATRRASRRAARLTATSRSASETSTTRWPRCTRRASMMHRLSTPPLGPFRSSSRIRRVWMRWLSLARVKWTLSRIASSLPGCISALPCWICTLMACLLMTLSSACLLPAAGLLGFGNDHPGRQRQIQACRIGRHRIPHLMFGGLPGIRSGRAALQGRTLGDVLCPSTLVRISIAIFMAISL